MCPERLTCVRNDLSQICPVITEGSEARLSQHCHSTVTALAYQERAMNGRDWTRRHGAATTVPPDRNGAGPAEAVRIREREAETAAAARLRPQARRLLQPLPLVGMLLVLVALVGYWSVYRASTKRTPVLVAAHALSAGSVLHASDLRAGELAGDGRTMAALVPERELDALLGRTLSAAVPAGAAPPPAA